MPKGKGSGGAGKPSSAGKQVNFRAPDDLLERLEGTADGLGLDVSNLIRMVLLENLTPYEERARQTRRTRERKEGCS